MRVRLLLLLVLASGCVRDGGGRPRPRHLVTVATETGGAVVSTPPAISCGAVCTGSFARGTVVTLEPRPDPGVRFDGWEGACTGKRLCVVAVNADLEVSARFVLADTGAKVPATLVRKSDLDKDGVADERDRCPVDAEDRDGVDDGDGCPDADPEPPPQDPDSGDRDADGLADVTDKCPDDPEDMDGFEDDDGCPDPDNDRDGILDVDDLCPSEPENKNGYQDADGCPDRR